MPHYKQNKNTGSHKRGLLYLLFWQFSLHYVQTNIIYRSSPQKYFYYRYLLTKTSLFNRVLITTCYYCLLPLSKAQGCSPGVGKISMWIFFGAVPHVEPNCPEKKPDVGMDIKQTSNMNWLSNKLINVYWEGLWIWSKRNKMLPEEMQVSVYISNADTYLNVLVIVVLGTQALFNIFIAWAPSQKRFSQWFLTHVIHWISHNWLK